MILSAIKTPDVALVIRNDTARRVTVEVGFTSDADVARFVLPPGAFQLVGVTPRGETSLSVGVQAAGEPMQVNKFGYFAPGPWPMECDRILIRASDDVAFDDCGSLHVFAGAVE